MSVIQVLGDEIAVPTSSGAATSFSEARRVRLVNTSNANRVIFVVETAGGTGIGSFTMAPFIAGGGDGDLVIEKDYTHCVYADDDFVKGAKVGFVG